MANVTVTLTGDEERLLRSLEKVIQKERELDSTVERGTGGIRSLLKDLGRDIDEVFGTKAGSKLMAFGAGFATFNAALTAAKEVLGQIKAELKAVIDLQQASGDRQLTLASARKDIVRNMPGANESEVRRMFEATSGIASRTKVGEEWIDRAMAIALSASGGDRAGSIRAVEVAARFLSDRPAEIGNYAGSLLDVSKITGSSDARTNLGLLTYVGGLARVADPELQARSIPPALIGIKGLGGTVRESAALFSALTVGAADITGEQSGNTAIKLAEQLREFRAGTLGQGKNADTRILKLLETESPAAGRKKLAERIGLLRQEELTDAEILKTLGTKYGYGREIEGLRARPTPGLPAGLTTGEEIAYLQARPDLAREFLKGATFRAKFIAPVEQLLTNPDSVIARKYAEFMRTIPEDPSAMLKSGTGIIGNFRADPLAIVAETKKSFASAEEQLLTRDPWMGVAAVTREGLIRTLKASGQGDLAQKFSKWEFEYETGLGRGQVIDQAARMLEDRIQAITPPKYLTDPWSGTVLPVEERKPDAATREQIAILRQLVEEVRKLNGLRSPREATLGIGPGEDR